MSFVPRHGESENPVLVQEALRASGLQRLSKQNWEPFFQPFILARHPSYLHPLQPRIQGLPGLGQHAAPPGESGGPAGLHGRVPDESPV